MQRIREAFSEGCEVELVWMADPYHKIPAGIRGLVIGADDFGTIHISWKALRFVSYNGAWPKLFEFRWKSQISFPENWIRRSALMTISANMLLLFMRLPSSIFSNLKRSINRWSIYYPREQLGKIYYLSNSLENITRLELIQNDTFL